MENIPKYRIFDSHCHIFPDKIADKATESIGHFYDLEMHRRGGADDLIRTAANAGITRCLVCSTATKPEQVGSINDFIHESCYRFPSMFMGFGTLHQRMPRDEIFAEVDRIKELGLRGIKLHPDFQRFEIDDPDMVPVYRYIAARRLPILFHTGDKRYDFSSPARLAHVNDLIPNLTVIGAHFGGFSQWEESRKLLAGRENIWFDTSSSLSFLDKATARDMIHELGADKFMFGTDFPMWEPEPEIQRFLALGLTEDENRAIFCENFMRLFNIE